MMIFAMLLVEGTQMVVDTVPPISWPLNSIKPAIATAHWSLNATSIFRRKKRRLFSASIVYCQNSHRSNLLGADHSYTRKRPDSQMTWLLSASAPPSTARFL